MSWSLPSGWSGFSLMWTSLIVIASLILGFVLVVISIATGFSVLVVPIIVLELVLLAALYLVRAELLSDEPAHEPRPGWREMPPEAPPRAAERSRLGPDLDKPADGMARRGNSPTRTAAPGIDPIPRGEPNAR